jgi:cell division protein FtsW
MMSILNRVESWFTPKNATGFKPEAWRAKTQLDTSIVYVVGFLLLLGLVMVYSSSIGLPESVLFKGKTGTHFLIRQGAFMAIGVALALIAFQIPMAKWNAYAPYLFLLSVALLAIVLLPFIGKLANNARRWIPVGPFTFQPSELMKWAVIVYTASYCVKKQDKIHSFKDGMLPMLIVIVVLGIELLAEPDLGALVVVAAVALGILFLGGSAIMPILMMGIGFVIAASIVIATSNRARRVLAFLDPWSPEFAKTEGFQLTNSLIAFGRGEFFGVGLGNSIEKLNHLSEAHTDFILAIIAEELGFLGVTVVVGCFGWIVFKAFSIGRRAFDQKKLFESLVAQGVGLWIGMQAGIHLCVNAGALPTKGLTLPFISYGGSAMLMSLLAIAVLLRIDYELRIDQRGQLL